MKVLVLSDRSPTDIVGGGEISLYSVLRELHEHRGSRLDLTVIALSPEHKACAPFDWHGIRIHPLPYLYEHTLRRAPQRPPDNAEAKEYFKYAAKWIRTASDFVRFHLKLKDQNSISSKTRLSLLKQNVLLFPNNQGELDHFDRAHRVHYDTTLLESVINAYKPDLIHADNLRSILRVSELKSPAKKVALVRDIRFFCPQRTEIGYYQDTLCAQCDFGCAKKIPTAARPSRLAVLENNRSYRREALNKFDTVLSTSGYLKTQLESFGVRAQVAVNAVSLTKVELSLKKPPTFLNVGMLNIAKGPDLFVEALSILRQRGHQFRGAIAGRGTQERRLRNQIQDAGLDDSTSLLGFVPHEKMPELLASSYAVVLPSRSPEGFGRVPLEAYAMGVPAIASNRGGYTETIIHKKTGYLIDGLQAESFANAMEELILNPSLRDEMGRRGNALLDEHYRCHHAAQALFEIYQSTVATP